MTSLLSYYSGVVDEQLDVAGKDLASFDGYNDVLHRFVPAYWVFVQSLNENESTQALEYYELLMDLVGVPDSDPERSFDFATLKSYFGY